MDAAKELELDRDMVNICVSHLRLVEQCRINSPSDHASPSLRVEIIWRGQSLNFLQEHTILFCMIPPPKVGG